MVQDVQVTSIRYAHIYKQSIKRRTIQIYYFWRTDSFIFFRKL